ncbi:MAG: hypothetical protein JSV94_06100 [Methanobacteriota archaeon]|nr:MAG: hypothetical protein JSV94_06100 [Euryarchaeota archaeon]
MRGLRSNSVDSDLAHADGSTGQNVKLSLIDRTVAVAPKRKRGRSSLRPLLVLILIVIMVAGAFSLASRNRDATYLPAHTAAQTIIPGFPLSYQHRDAPGVTCAMCGSWMPWHLPPVLWEDVKYGGAPGGPPGDNTYGPTGSPDDCPHCIVYSGPACIQMINGYRSGGPLVPQDQIYDDSEYDIGAFEIRGDTICQRHGYGVLDGTGGSIAEIQKTFDNWINPHHQHNQWDASALTAPTLCSYISSLYPVLWDDHGGWPSNMDRTWPIPPEDTMQGHYKVIAGYDDQGTPSTLDDCALIYDPWPGYNDLAAVNPTPLPPGALPGPGGPGVPDPYWLPVSTVLGDTNDLFLVEYAAIPEFSSLLIPILGMTVIALVAIRIRAARRDS